MATCLVTIIFETNLDWGSDFGADGFNFALEFLQINLFCLNAFLISEKHQFVTIFVGFFQLSWHFGEQQLPVALIRRKRLPRLRRNDCSICRKSFSMQILTYCMIA